MSEDAMERRVAEIEGVLDLAAATRADAEAAEARMKHKLSVMTDHHREAGLAMGASEHKARASSTYEAAMEEWIVANDAYRRADAKADAAKLRIDVWRTRASTERAKMNLR